MPDDTFMNSTTATTPTAQQTYIGRQPIFDNNLAIYAYELLYRGGQKNESGAESGQPFDGDAATAQVMLNAFIEVGLDNLVGKSKAFLNYTQKILTKEHLPFFSRHQVVIEVLEDVEVTPKVVAAVRALKKNGYVIALDDFYYDEKYEPLIDLADIIKIDIMGTGMAILPEHVRKIKRPNIKLLAEKVETQSEYEQCKALGFDYYQGYFFAKPVIVEGQRLAANKLAMLQLLANIYDPDVDMNKLSSIISHDVGLSHKLIKFVRVEALKQGKEVEINSVRDAVLRFGLEKLQSWVTILLMAGVDDKPSELYRIALIRAEFMAQIALKTQHNREQYFTTGLFSTLDAMLDIDMATALQHLGLAKAVENAIQHHEGDLGKSLQTVKQIEAWEQAGYAIADMDPLEISKLYLESVKWAHQFKF